MPSCLHSICFHLLMELLLYNRDWNLFQKLWGVFLYVCVLWVSGLGARGCFPEECRYMASLWQKAAFVKLQIDKCQTRPAAWPNIGERSETKCYCHRADWGRQVVTHQYGAGPVSYITASSGVTETTAVIYRETLLLTASVMAPPG